MEDHVVSEPEEIGDFLYDIRNELTNYTCYYKLRITNNKLIEYSNY